MFLLIRSFRYFQFSFLIIAISSFIYPINLSANQEYWSLEQSGPKTIFEATELLKDRELDLIEGIWKQGDKLFTLAIRSETTPNSYDYFYIKDDFKEKSSCLALRGTKKGTILKTDSARGFEIYLMKRLNKNPQYIDKEYWNDPNGQSYCEKIYEYGTDPTTGSIAKLDTLRIFYVDRSPATLKRVWPKSFYHHNKKINPKYSYEDIPPGVEYYDHDRKEWAINNENSVPTITSPENTIVEGEISKEDLIPVASGSGFFINDESYIITNDHVVSGCNSMTVLIDGNEYDTNIIATDKVNDIALLKSSFQNQSYFEIALNDVERAEEIKAIGFGFGKNYSSDIKVTAGIVNSLSGYNDNYSEFQMDAPIQSGNSGGPVINKHGNLVGISVAALDSLAVLEDTGTLPQNVNYAIKASTLKQFLKSKEINFSESDGGWFSFTSNRKINKLIDSASVYLSCYMTYAQIKENSTKKVMFENLN